MTTVSKTGWALFIFAILLKVNNIAPVELYQYFNGAAAGLFLSDIIRIFQKTKDDK